jgi:hypothetical protein
MRTNQSHYLVIDAANDGEVNVIVAASRQKAAEDYFHQFEFATDEVQVYTLPAHNPEPTTFRRETKAVTLIVEVTE